MSTQFGNQQQQPDSAQWNVPPYAPGHNLPPNPQIWNVPTAQPWNPPASHQWNNPANRVMTQSPAFHQEFLKGKPKGLGVTLIVLGILHIGMGIGLLFTSYVTAGNSGIPFWGAVLNIIAGSLSVSAVSKPSMCLTGGHVLRGLFILTYLLQFSISVSLSVFACRADCDPNLTQPAQVFVIQNGGAVLQPTTVPGTYPMYPPQQPHQLPYMTQGGMNGFGNQQQQQKPDSNQWNVPPGGPGHNLPPNLTAQPWNPPASNQWNNPATTVMTQSPAFHQEFLKGKPKSLGVILIVVGILHIGMGIGLLYTSYNVVEFSGIPFWGAVFNIIAGSLSVAAVSKPSMCLIKGSLGLSIVVSISSVTGLILNIVEFIYRYYYSLSYCYYDCSGLLTGGHVLRGLFILTYLLQFSVSVSLSVFAGRADSHINLTQPAQVFVIQNGGEVLQTNAAPGTYPMYPPQQPPQLPYMVQGGMNVGPTA
ncbi:uncharacterized protein ACMZJ9_014341 [Mantella aurantiaca]